MVAAVELSIFCFRWIPPAYRDSGRDEKAIDALNEQLLVALQRDGSSYSRTRDEPDVFALILFVYHRPEILLLFILFRRIRTGRVDPLSLVQCAHEWFGFGQRTRPLRLLIAFGPVRP